MKHLILCWSAVLALSVSMAAVGCSKAETEGSVAETKQAPAPSKEEPPTTAGVDKGAPQGQGEGGEDGKSRHDKMVENAKNAIPTVASDDQTNAAMAATGDKKIAQGEVAAAKKELAATANAVPAAKSTVADTSTYTVVVDAPTGAAGKDSRVTVVVKPKKGWKLNMEFPTKLKVSPPAGVTVAKATLKKGDAKVFSEKQGATWEISYKSAAAGKKQFSGKLKFAVCTDATCDPKSETLAFAVDVK
jgi:hypothetical protein